jgi:hypothetical protein
VALRYTVTVCSDLHHGPEGHPANDETPGWWFLWNVTPDPKLRLGDMDELWQFTREQIGQLVGTDVAGNHDCTNCTTQLIRHGDTIFLHGHQFDPLNSGPLKVIGKAVTGFFGLLEKVIDKDIDIWAEQVLLKRGRNGNALKYSTKAAAYAKKRGATQIVFGHLHQRFTADVDGIRVVCVGCCCNGSMDFVEVEVWE